MERPWHIGASLVGKGLMVYGEIVRPRCSVTGWERLTNHRTPAWSLTHGWPYCLTTECLAVDRLTVCDLVPVAINRLIISQFVSLLRIRYTRQVDVKNRLKTSLSRPCACGGYVEVNALDFNTQAPVKQQSLIFPVQSGSIPWGRYL